MLCLERSWYNFFKTYLGFNFSDFGGSEENSWLSSDAAKHRMEIFSLMPTICKPINSLDVNRTRLLCGSDNEAVYLIKNLSL